MISMNKLVAMMIVCCTALTACNYSFKEGSIPKEVKTIKIHFIENKAGYVNPQLSPQLTDKLRQKVTNQTRLTQVQGDDADYEVKCTITGYMLGTSGISNQQAASNRLTVNVHIDFKNRLDPTGKTVTPKDFQKDVSKFEDFSASLSLPQAEGQILPGIISGLTDAIFNELFSNW